MLKSFILIIFTLFFIACGENNSQSGKNTTTTSSKYLTIRHAPLNTSSLVSRNERITLSFSDTLDANTINNSSVYLEDDKSVPVGAIIETGTNSQSITIIPYSYLLPTTLYTVVVTTQIKDTQGRSLKEDYRYSFTTAPDTALHPAPTLQDRKPDVNATGVARQTTIALDFKVPLSLEAEQNTSPYIKLSDSTGNVYRGKVEVFNSILKFIPSALLPADTNITVELLQPVKDMYGKSSPTVAPWSFTTSASNALIPNDGYGVIGTLATNQAPSLMQQIETNASRSLVAVAHAQTITLYSVNYTALPTKPTISRLGSLTLGSTITAIERYNPLSDLPQTYYLLVGTVSNGLYVVRHENNTPIEVANYPLNEAVYNITAGKNVNGLVDKVHVVGPRLGLKIFKTNITSSQLTAFKDVNTSVVGTALDVIDDIDVYKNSIRNVYIADYNGRVVVLDENGTYKRAIDINGSVKKIISQEDVNGVNYCAITSLGSVQIFDSNSTTYNPSKKFDLLDGFNYVSSYNSTEFGLLTFYSDGGKNIIVGLYDFYNNPAKPVTKQGLIQMSDNIISTTIVTSPINPFLLTLSQSGTLMLQNITGPKSVGGFGPAFITATPANGAVSVATDANITVNFDMSVKKYLDTATISENSFTLVDLNQSTTPALPTTFTLSGKVNANKVVYTLNPDNNLTFQHTYSPNNSIPN